ncbi:hypothetical protein Tco_0426655, partial [Tanacetum coccineum]
MTSVKSTASRLGVAETEEVTKGKVAIAATPISAFKTLLSNNSLITDGDLLLYRFDLVVW